jgi:DNA-binding winged helix-turn-helix (wHTH) protein
LNPDLHIHTSLQFPGFQLDLSSQCLWRLDPAQAATRIDLPPKTFAVLRHLVEHAQQLMSFYALLEAVWPDVHVQPEVLKGHVAAIRRALGDDASQPRYVETHRGQGYRFIAPVGNLAVGGESGFFARRSSMPCWRHTGVQRPARGRSCLSRARRVSARRRSSTSSSLRQARATRG